MAVEIKTGRFTGKERKGKERDKEGRNGGR